MTDPVYVVQEQPTGRWLAGCCDTRCGYFLHDLADSTTKSRAEAAAARHRKLLRTLPREDFTPRLRQLSYLRPVHQRHHRPPRPRPRPGSEAGHHHRGDRVITQPDRLHHLLDRARRGVILPAEGEALAGLVGDVEAERQQAHETETENTAREIDRALTAEARVRDLEATVARIRQAVDADPVGACCAHLIHAALNPPAP
ncbi:hypothetical protein [Streptomyces griseus]|uniref:hypothetical protein n=1 Tax=Streptomyces griseus TaxID=1911 RepID=UPI0036A5996E